MFKKLSSPVLSHAEGKAADDLTPGAYWKVREDDKASRTQLEGFFNIPGKEIVRCPH